MSAIEVTTNSSEVAKEFGLLGSAQIPFALARTVTNLAFMSRGPVQSEMDEALTLRNRFSKGGIQVASYGTKTKPEASIGIEETRSYLLDHVTGGKREGGKHGRAILDDDSADELRSGSGKVPRGSRPGALIKKAEALAGKTGKKRKAKGTGRNLPFLFHAHGWGNEVLAKRAGKERYPLVIVYAFKRDVTIKKEFDMVGEVEGVVGKHFDSEFGKQLARAIASGKSKADRQGSMSRGVEIDAGR